MAASCRVSRAPDYVLKNSPQEKTQRGRADPMVKNNELNISTEALVKVSLTVLTLVFFWHVRDVVVLLLLSITVAAALDSLVDYLSKKKIPRALSLLSVFLL